MNLTVKVVANGFETVVHSLEELYKEIRQYDPEIFVSIEFLEKGELYEASCSATVDP